MPQTRSQSAAAMRAYDRAQERIRNEVADVVQIATLGLGIAYFARVIGVILVSVKIWEMEWDTVVKWVVVLVWLFWVGWDNMALRTLVCGLLFVYWEFVYLPIAMWTLRHVDSEGMNSELVDLGAVVLFVLAVEQFTRV